MHENWMVNIKLNEINESLTARWVCKPDPHWFNADAVPDPASGFLKPKMVQIVFKLVWSNCFTHGQS